MADGSLSRIVRRVVPGAYRLRYWRRVLTRSSTGGGAPPDNSRDLTFVVARANKGWVLDRVAHELARASVRTNGIAYTSEPLPHSKTYFFTHWQLYLEALTRGLVMPSVVYVTHLPDGLDLRELVYGLRYAAGVVCMNAAAGAALRRLGVPADRIITAPGAADPDVFQPDSSAHGDGVLLSAAYYPRKNPDLLLAIVRRRATTRFRLVGTGWQRWDGFRALVECPNFEYIEAAYSDYPAVYRTCDRFLSTSRLEGGPIPLLEAMMSGLTPVVTNTGFAPDVIRHGENGFLFEGGASAESITGLLDQRPLPVRVVRESVLQYSWTGFAHRVLRFIDAVAPATSESIHQAGR
jgi:glycosyltransferase involved in cell wall biosynthesis